MGVLFFGFGLAAGILGAHTATGFLEDSAGLILSVFLSAALVVLILGVLIFALRRTILMRLFGHAEVALAGTALHFTQKQRISDQTDLLREQNQRIHEQTQLIQTDVQLA